MLVGFEGGNPSDLVFGNMVPQCICVAYNSVQLAFWERNLGLSLGMEGKWSIVL